MSVFAEKKWKWKCPNRKKCDGHFFIRTSNFVVELFRFKVIAVSVGGRWHVMSTRVLVCFASIGSMLLFIYALLPPFPAIIVTHCSASTSLLWRCLSLSVLPFPQRLAYPPISFVRFASQAFAVVFANVSGGITIPLWCFGCLVRFLCVRLRYFGMLGIVVTFALEVRCSFSSSPSLLWLFSILCRTCLCRVVHEFVLCSLCSCMFVAMLLFPLFRNMLCPQVVAVACPFLSLGSLCFRTVNYYSLCWCHSLFLFHIPCLWCVFLCPRARVGFVVS